MGSSIVTKLLILFYLISQMLLTALKQSKYKWILYLSNILNHNKKCDFSNEGTFTWTLSVQDLPFILKWHNFQSRRSLEFFMELKFCKSNVYFLSRRKICVGGLL